MEGTTLIVGLLFCGGVIFLLIYSVLQLGRSSWKRAQRSSQDDGGDGFVSPVAGDNTERSHDAYDASDGGDWGAGDGGGDGSGGGGD